MENTPRKWLCPYCHEETDKLYASKKTITNYTYYLNDDEMIMDDDDGQDFTYFCANCDAELTDEDKENAKVNY